MLRYFKHSKDIKCNDWGEFEHKYQTICKRNIVDLVKHALHKMFLKPPKIKGLNKGSKNVKVPEFYIEAGDYR